MNQSWVEKTYEAIANEVAAELSMLKEVILSEDDLCKNCIMKQPNEEVHFKSDFEWPADYECARGSILFPDHAHFCQHFVERDKK